MCCMRYLHYIQELRSFQQSMWPDTHTYRDLFLSYENGACFRLALRVASLPIFVWLPVAPFHIIFACNPPFR